MSPMRSDRRPRPSRAATSRKTQPRRDSGATQSRSRIAARLHSWLDHHRLTAIDSFQRLVATPASSTMTWLVIGIALALPAALLVGLQNLENISRGWDGAAQMSLFLESSVADADGRKLADQLASR